MDSVQLDRAVEIAREALLLAVKLSLPLLVAGLVVGAVISIVQAATQVQEPSLHQVPKMLAIAAVLFFAMPWLLAALVEYTHELVRGMGAWFR